MHEVMYRAVLEHTNPAVYKLRSVPGSDANFLLPRKSQHTVLCIICSIANVDNDTESLL